jgi:nitroreductase
MKDTLTIIAQRKSVRHFTDQSLTDKQFEILLRAAMAAPSAKNIQAWEFIVITDRIMLDKMGESLPYAKMLIQAPAAIVVCGNVSKYTPESELNWVSDCAAATENILLAAEAIGLAAVWTASFPYPERIAAVREAVKNMPEEIVPLAVIPVGYAARDEKVKDKWHPEKIHYNQW